VSVVSPGGHVIVRLPGSPRAHRLSVPGFTSSRGPPSGAGSKRTSRACSTWHPPRTRKKTKEVPRWDKSRPCRSKWLRLRPDGQAVALVILDAACCCPGPRCAKTGSSPPNFCSCRLHLHPPCAPHPLNPSRAALSSVQHLLALLSAAPIAKHTTTYYPLTVGTPGVQPPQPT
jgi:hypothetical protein